MKRPLFDVGITVLLGSAVVLYGNIYCYLLLPYCLQQRCSVQAGQQIHAGEKPLSVL